jgi:hypothetical protein
VNANIRFITDPDTQHTHAEIDFSDGDLITVASPSGRFSRGDADVIDRWGRSLIFGLRKMLEARGIRIDWSKTRDAGRVEAGVARRGPDASDGALTDLGQGEAGILSTTDGIHFGVFTHPEGHDSVAQLTFSDGRKVTVASLHGGFSYENPEVIEAWRASLLFALERYLVANNVRMGEFRLPQEPGYRPAKKEPARARKKWWR